MNRDIPEPMTPPACDLRDFPFMPLLISRLRRSRAWLKAKRQPELGFYMVNLWCASWHEVPGGSLENDNDVLADLAMCSPAHWPSVRDDALHGWVVCSDGRLYHPVIAEQVLDAWGRKQGHRDRLAKARAAKAERSAQTREMADTGSSIEPVTEPMTDTTIEPVTEPVIDLGIGLTGTGTVDSKTVKKSIPPVRSPAPPPAAEPAPALVVVEGKPKRGKAPPAVPPADWPLPDWMPPSAWAGFVEMRRAIRKPLTEPALKLAIAKLDKLRAAGHDPGAVLEQSTLRSWAGLFEVKPDHGAPVPRLALVHPAKPADPWGDDTDASPADPPPAPPADDWGVQAWLARLGPAERNALADYRVEVCVREICAAARIGPTERPNLDVLLDWAAAELAFTMPDVLEAIAIQARNMRTIGNAPRSLRAFDGSVRQTAKTFAQITNPV